jgi:hypothetical protein
MGASLEEAVMPFPELPPDDPAAPKLPRMSPGQVIALKNSAEHLLEQPVDHLNMVAIYCVNLCDDYQHIGNAHPHPHLGDCATHGCLREHVQRAKWVAKGFLLPAVLKPGAPRPPMLPDEPQPPIDA